MGGAPQRPAGHLSCGDAVGKNVQTGSAPTRGRGFCSPRLPSPLGTSLSRSCSFGLPCAGLAQRGDWRSCAHAALHRGDRLNDKSNWRVAHLGDIERRGGELPMREHLRIHAFGINAFASGEDGTLVNDHDESETGQEEL